MNYYRKTVGFLASSRIGRVMMLGIVAMLAFSSLADAANQRRGAKVKSIVVESAAPTLTVGMEYQGGKIAYIDETGQHGLIAATADATPAGDGIIWAVAEYQSTSVSGTGTAIGTGSANTDKIIDQHNGVDVRTYAAGLARAYRGGNYTDWYLPSQEELNQLYENREAIGDFVINDAYWSSSESNFSNKAWNHDFTDGRQWSGSKYKDYRVRPVRAF